MITDTKEIKCSELSNDGILFLFERTQNCQ